MITFLWSDGTETQMWFPAPPSTQDAIALGAALALHQAAMHTQLGRQEMEDAVRAALRGIRGCQYYGLPP